MASGYLEYYLWIYAHVNDINLDGLLSYLIPLQLWQLKILFGDGLINFNKFFLKSFIDFSNLCCKAVSFSYSNFMMDAAK